jgi:glycosyltransferase involved in cell wall biosynthesis
MKKILFIHDYPLQEGGGVEIQTYADAVALRKRGYSVCIASSRASSETYTASKDRCGTSYVSEDGVELYLVQTYSQLREKIQCADIVHIQATYSMRPAMMSAMRLCISLGKKYIVTLHTNSSHIPFSALGSMSEFEKDILIEEFKQCIQNPLCTVCGVSQSVTESLARIGVYKDAQVIYNAKEWDDFLCRADMVDSIETVDITYCGEVSWMKGMHVFLGALSLLLKDKPNLSVRIIGGGQDKKEVQTLVESLGMSGSVTCVPYIENKKLPAYLASTSILVQPSLSETWGNIVMEAVACGASVVVSNTEGLSELVSGTHDDSVQTIGDMFERGNVYDMYKKLLYRLQNQVSESEKTKRSAYVQDRYSMKNRISQLLSLYSSVMLKSRATQTKIELIEFCPKID